MSRFASPSGVETVSARISSGSGSPASLPGEPGVTIDGVPPFVAEDEQTRWLFSLNRFGIRPGLHRIEALLADLDHPEREVPSLVVAGTNGKGSTTHLLAALLQGAGYRVGCYTSPHLLRVYERLLIDGRPCPADRFAATLRRLRPLVERHEASWFETLTALAVLIARQERLDFLCCETGLGGRLDATNGLPALAILLTGVAEDHQHILGQTVAEIAAEKLGLLKAGVPLFASVAPSLKPQVFRAAVAAGSPCRFLDEMVRWEPAPPGWRLRTVRSCFEGLPEWGLPVLRQNLGLALLCLEELAARGRLALPPSPALALADVFLPARHQVLLHEPDWLLDTAHNTEALRLALDAYLARPCAGRRWVLFGCMREKALGPEVGARLRRCGGIVAAPVSLPRSRNRQELLGLLKEWHLAGGTCVPPDRGETGRPCGGGVDVHVAADLDEALGRLTGMLGSQDAVLVTGSCFLVAETLHRLGYRELTQTRLARPASAALAPFGYQASVERTT
jgi:dihydrofolate synthase/folylpolyglutamate synthase